MSFCHTLQNPAKAPSVPGLLCLQEAADANTLDDFGPTAEPRDHSWCSVAGTTTHWADTTEYAAEANQKLKAGLIGPPLDPPPQGEQLRPSVQ